MKAEVEVRFLDVGFVMAAYRAEYPHLTLKDTVAKVSVVKFDEPLPDLLEA